MAVERAAKKEKSKRERRSETDGVAKPASKDRKKKKRAEESDDRRKKRLAKVLEEQSLRPVAAGSKPSSDAPDPDAKPGVRPHGGGDDSDGYSDDDCSDDGNKSGGEGNEGVDGMEEDDGSDPGAAEDDDESGDDEALSRPRFQPILVPFAVPLARDKHLHKVLKYVRKSAKANVLRRGVKEVVKTLRKSPAAGPSNKTIPGVVVLAGDISPIDIISHLPVLCEDHDAPYIFVPSRADLGSAAATKRPTSVVMVCSVPASKKEVPPAAVADFPSVYKHLISLVRHQTLRQTRC